MGGRLGEPLRLSPLSSGLRQQILRALPLDLGHRPLAKWPFPLGGAAPVGGKGGAVGRPLLTAVSPGADSGATLGHSHGAGQGRAAWAV